MKENTFQDNFLFKLDTNLIDDINCLLTFIRQPLCLEKLFEKIPSDILQEKLYGLEFKLERRRNIPYFLITHNNSNKISRFELTNNHLSSLGITITDQNQLVKPLLDAKNKKLGSNLKDFLTTLVEDTNNNNNKLNLNSNLPFIKDRTSNLPENKNKQTEINIFFSFIEKYLIFENNSKNPISNTTAESLLILADTYSKLEKIYPDLNTITSKIHSFLNKSALNDISIKELMLAYEKLSCIATHFLPEVKEKSKISYLIDILIGMETDNSFTDSNFNFFKLSSLKRKGFQYTFGDEENIIFYEAVQKNYKNFSSLKETYLQIVYLIHELYLSSEKNQKIIDMSRQLNDLTDLFFQNILDTSNFNTNENLEQHKKEIFTKFQNEVKDSIKEFRKENLINLKQLDTLDKILNYIAKLIPSFILSKDERVGFFKSRTPQNKKIDKILDNIQKKLT